MKNGKSKTAFQPWNNYKALFHQQINETWNMWGNDQHYFDNEQCFQFLHVFCKINLYIFIQPQTANTAL